MSGIILPREPGRRAIRTSKNLKFEKEQVEEFLDKRENDIETRLKKAQSRVTRSANKIKRLNDDIKNKKNDVKWYTWTRNLGPEEKKLKEAEAELLLAQEAADEWPQQRRRQVTRIRNLAQEIEEVKANEALEKKRAKRQSEKEALGIHKPSTSSTPVGKSAETATKKPAEPPKPKLNFFGFVTNTSKAKIRKEVIKVPVQQGQTNGNISKPPPAKKAQPKNAPAPPTSPSKSPSPQEPAAGKKRKAESAEDGIANKRTKRDSTAASAETSLRLNGDDGPTRGPPNGLVDLDQEQPAPVCPEMGGSATAASEGNGKTANAPSAPIIKRKRSQRPIPGERGVAQVIGKKRTAFNESDDAPASKKAKSDPKAGNTNIGGNATSASATNGPKTTTRRHLNGLRNQENACFSNSTIQLLDAAFEDQDKDAILGDLDAVESFGLNSETLKRFDSSKNLNGKPAKIRRQDREVRAAIKAAAKNGEAEKASVAKHFRSLLADLESQQEDDKASPYLFQSVMAFGDSLDADRAANDVSDRQQVSGDTQEDAHDYYVKVQDMLANDPYTKDADALKASFEVKTEVQDVCARYNCMYKSEPRTVTENYHDISVPEKKDNSKAGKEQSKPVSLKELMSNSKFVAKGEQCPKCGEDSLHTKTQFVNVGDNFVVKMSRTRFDTTKNVPYKVATLVDTDLHEYEIQGTKYELTVVVRHKGQTTRRGHYTAFRKHAGEWYLLDDGKCDKVDQDQVKDSMKGQSAMLLFKKVAA